MDCIFRILTKDKETYEKLKKSADAHSEKGLIIIHAKCGSFEFLKKFNVEMLITPATIGEGEDDCFYYNGQMKECSSEIFEMFDVSKYEPLVWKDETIEDTPF